MAAKNKNLIRKQLQNNKSTNSIGSLYYSYVGIL